MKKTILTVAAALAVSGAVLADKLLINGAGATFPFPLYSKWFSQYNKLHPDIQINYQSIGSGGGIKQITERTVDFGASDAPLSDEQLQKASGVQHIPTVMGAVVIVWNLPGVQQLRIAPETLAAIYLGKVTKWNDAALKNDNPTAKLPDTAITVAHRSDGSGTTNIFTDYLSKVSPDWKSGPGKGTSVNWPAGLGGKGNEGVTGLVKQTEGAVGYVELAYANQNKLPTAELKSHDGEWVKASLESVSAAAAKAAIPEDYRVSITDQPGDGAYPTAAFTYLLVYRDQQDAAKGSALLNFIWWAVHDGQKEAAALDYAPLPKPVVEKVEQTLKRMTVNGKPVLASSK
ncbi:MAG: phosphate ABC transporter substrate-binding protein PstS [Deltaproteobacteria bacterium]|nr:MAG: phosphate ABC transporter substrate-binding protein PstS [Deltaproteobacteria bacterium]TMB33302.1 MAG: phosphate ABC transporter substrate-binding protein PstS [Deltaproteobacteria bacterium]